MIITSATTTPATSTATTIFDRITTRRRTPIPFVRRSNNNSNNNTLIVNNNNKRSSRRSAQQIYYKMDRNFQQLVRQHNNSIRLSHPFSYTTSRYLNTYTNRAILNRTISSDRSSNTRFVGESSNREGIGPASSANSRILQFNVCHSQKEWRRATSFQSEEIEPVLGGSSFQDGNNQGSIANDKTKRLPSLNRFIGCFSAYSSPPGISTVSTAEMEKPSVPILYHPFWFGPSPFVFTKVCRPILEYFRSQAFRVSTYLDD
ncbi:hypothetical protein G6F68_009681 [Rhizopus microsporus]|nr:hypothetical protein G6F68_009681 [Rhizopus microsporus]